MTLPCAGVIVLHDEKTVLVETYCGHLGFPKGKRHKKETLLDCALRELAEETGLCFHHITLIEGLHVDEISVRGNPNTRYFVAFLNEKAKEKPLVCDPDELKSVMWYSIPTIRIMLPERFKLPRQVVLNTVIEALRV